MHDPAERPTEPGSPAERTPVALPERYVHRGVVGRGGQGEVHRVFDADLEREVALKTLHRDRCSPEAARMFVEEARAAASLEHPNVVPIHDVGELLDGRPYYTMRLLSGRSLAERLDAEGGGGGEQAEPLSVVRVAQVMQQVCRALQFAHERGVIHRDVKPANILLGPFGEVLVVDWGIAKTTALGRPQTASGIVKGTVAYMSPEQARGEPLGPGSDVYAVGVTLFEALTLELPFAGASSGELLAAILRDAPRTPDEVAPERRIPPELSELVMRLIDRDPAERVASAGEAADELQAYLEGERDRERRLAAAGSLEVEAVEAMERHALALREAESLRHDIVRLEEVHPPWQPVREKLQLIDARSLLAELERTGWESFLDAVKHYMDALVHVPDHASIRRSLADLFMERFRAAEEQRHDALSTTYRSLVERFDDGRHAAELDGRGVLHASVEPAIAELVLHRQEERNLRLVDGPARPIDPGPAGLSGVEHGSYVVVARAPGYAPVRIPVHVPRAGEGHACATLLADGSLPDGFVHLPGAETWLGGDEKASNAWPLRRVRLEPFALARHPVTLGQYRAFLNAVDDEQVVPRVESGGEIVRGGPGAWELARSDLVAWTQGRVPPARLQDIPVFGVTRPAAEAYAAWLSTSTGRRYRLPTAEEWEYAARGVDRRIYPWGDAFDAALCHGRDSLAEQPRLAPVGEFGDDESVHGIRDLAGCIQEWTASWFDEGRRLAEVRGGGWSSGPPIARCAWRGIASEYARNSSLGFRIALDP